MNFVPKKLERTGDISRGKPRLRDWVKGLLSIAAVLALAYVVLGMVADTVANSISEETEAELFQWIEIGEKPGDEEFVRAQLIFDRLCKIEGLRPLPYRLE